MRSSLLSYERPIPMTIFLYVSLSLSSAAEAFGLVIMFKMWGDLLQCHSLILINLSDNTYGYTSQCNVNHEVFWHVVIWRVNLICTIKCRCCVSALYCSHCLFSSCYCKWKQKNLQLAKTEIKVFSREFLTPILKTLFLKKVLNMTSTIQEENKSGIFYFLCFVEAYIYSFTVFL